MALVTARQAWSVGHGNAAAVPVATSAPGADDGTRGRARARPTPDPDPDPAGAWSYAGGAGKAHPFAQAVPRRGSLGCIGPGPLSDQHRLLGRIESSAAVQPSAGASSDNPPIPYRPPGGP